MNRLQEKLVRRLFNTVKEKYPNIEFLNVENSPEDPDDLLVNALVNYDEDTQIEISNYSSTITSDILDEYYQLIHFMVVPVEYEAEYRILPNHKPFNISEAA